MKKTLIILSSLLLITSITSCSHKESSSNSNINKPTTEENKPSVDTTPSTDSTSNDTIQYNAFEIYNNSVNKMKELTYEMECEGTSTNSMLSSSLDIYEIFQHRTNAIYFEKLSSGQGIKFIANVSFAERAYIDSNKALRQSAARSNKNPTPWDKNSDGKFAPVYTESSRESNKNNIWNEFGKHGDNFTIYTINENTVLNDYNVKVNEKENYVLDFNLKIDNSLSSDSVIGLDKQVLTMSKYPLYDVVGINLEFEIDKDYKVISFSSKESYVVSGPINTHPTVDNDLTYTFKFYDKDEDLKLKTIPDPIK